MIHGNWSSSKLAAPCTELVIKKIDSCLDESKTDLPGGSFSIHFRNERGFVFQKNWRFEMMTRNDIDSMMIMEFDLPQEELVGVYALIGNNNNELTKNTLNRINQEMTIHLNSTTSNRSFICPFSLLVSKQPSSERDDFDIDHSSKCFHGLLVDDCDDVERQHWSIGRRGVYHDNHLRVQLTSSGHLVNNTICLYIFSSNSPEKALQIYTNELTGKCPLPPLWSLGCHVMDDKLENMKNMFESQKLPIDCLHVNSHKEFDLSILPRGTHMVVLIENVKTNSCDWKHQLSSHITALQQEQRGESSQETIGICCKSIKGTIQNEREVMSATIDVLNDLKPNQRNFVMSNYGFSGIQQFCCWSLVNNYLTNTDDDISWDDLGNFLKSVLNLNIAGQSACGMSVSPSTSFVSTEVFIRYLQLSCLLPFFQIPSKYIGSQQQQHQDDNCSRLDLISPYIHLRYQLMPYIYTQIQQAFSRGIPFCKPMFLQYPTWEASYGPEWESSQFFIGDSLLVAPIMDPNKSMRKVHLPPDDSWYELPMDDSCIDSNSQNFDWHMLVDNCTLHEGNQIITCSARTTEQWLSRIPIFVRAGSIIPIRTIPPDTQVKNMDDLKTKCELQFVMFPDHKRRRAGNHEDLAPSEGILYHDDGHSLNYKDGKFSLFRLYCAERFCGMDSTMVQWEQISGQGA